MFKLLKFAFGMAIALFTTTGLALNTNLACPPASLIQANAEKLDKADLYTDYYQVYSPAVVIAQGKFWQITTILKNMKNAEQALKQAKLNAKQIEVGLNAFAERGTGVYTCYYIPGDIRAVTLL